MSAPNAVNAPATAPNATADISVNITAPTASGDHTGYWQMRNSQGTYFGQKIWVKVKTVAPSGGGGTSHITLFDISPVSPSAATSVHLVGRISTFPEFRSMRFVAGNNTFEMTNFQSVGSQYEISADWNTASLARGNYTITLEVAAQGDTNWTNPERQVRTYTLNGTPTSTNHPPERPVLLSPYNWYLKDAAGASAQVQMCVSAVNDPDGDAVQYYFEWSGANPGNSGWVNSTCVSPTLSPNGYAWHAKARDSHGAESGWSVDTWNFNVASGGVSIGSISGAINYSDLDQSYICVPVTYGGIQGPDVKAFINLAADGSENGDWKQLDGFGPNAGACPQPNVWGFRVMVVNYDTGNHRIRVSALKPDSGASALAYYTFNMPYLRPPAPHALAPSSPENNGTWWNTRTITFTWTLPLRTQSQTLRVSTSSDVWGDPAPLFEAALGSTVTTTSHTFTQDYAHLYWSIRASNSTGAAASGVLWFGIDLVAPACSIPALPSMSYENNFQVHWNGIDALSGIGSYNIQYEDSRSGQWSDWQTSVPAAKTYDLFIGQPGHAYSFRCQAKDNAGNPGQYPASGDTSISIDPSSRPQEPWWLAAYGRKRNITIQNNMPAVALPANYPVNVQFTTTTSPTAAEIYNLSQSANKCDDLRILYDNATQLNRFIKKCASDSIDIWFRTQAGIPAGGTDAHYQMYIGNPSASNPPADASQIWYPYRESDTTNLYLFQEGSGSTAYDSSGYGRNCTINPSVNWSTAKWGTGLHFNHANNGSTVSLTCGNPGSLSSLTSEFWFKPDPAGFNVDGRLAGQLGPNGQLSWLVSIESDRMKFERWCNGGSQQARGTINLRTPAYSQWTYLAVTFNGGNQVKFYVNGILDNTVTLDNSCSATYNVPLEIGSVEGGGQGQYYIGAFRLSNGVKTDFPPGSLANITIEPNYAIGIEIIPPVTGQPDLAIQFINTYPDPTGGILVQAVVQNQGTLDTQNGFYTDLYLNHVPTGAGDFTGSLRFWVNDPIAAGATVTLTTVINDLSTLSGSEAQALAPGSETSGTLYAQVDSMGVVKESNKSNNIYSAGTGICIATADFYEPDDNAGTASTINLGQTQTHNFDLMGDQDLIKFTAEAGKTYRLTTSIFGVSADTYLYLYDTNGQTLLASNDDYNNSLASQIIWTAPQNGTYYVMVKNWNPNSAGCGTSYDFSLTITPPSFHIYLPLVIR
jgi:hypothetical protein